MGCVAGAELPQQPQPTPTAAPIEVEDLGPEWLDYDTIPDTTDDGMFQEEFGVPSQRRAIPPAPVIRPRLSLPIVEGAGPMPPMDGVPPEELEPQSEYERIQQENIRQCREEWRVIFGVEYPNVE